MEKLIKIIISIIILVTLLLLNVVFWGSSDNFYSQIHKDLEIKSKVITSQNQLDYINQEFTDYLKFKRNNLNIKIEVNNDIVEVFNDKEISHMKDVKNLFKIAYILILVGLITVTITMFFLLKKKKIRYIYNVVKSSLIIATLITLIFALVFTVGFNVFWHYFHKVFFTNDLYLLNPKTDFLIQIMPLDFFIKMSIRILISFYISQIVILLISKIGVVFYDKNRS